MMKSRASKEFVAKLQHKNIEHRTITDLINDVIIEVAIGKLCSALGIGPAFETNIPFDIIAYEDATQFHLEWCETAMQNLSECRLAMF
jgi:serine/threonine protein kinase